VPREPPEDVGVDRRLLLDRGGRHASQEQELRPHETAPLGARFDRGGDVVDRTDVRGELDVLTVGGASWLVAERGEAAAATLLLEVASFDLSTRRWVGIDDHLARPTVHRDVGPRPNGAEQAFAGDDRRDAQCSGEDRGMARRRAGLRHERRDRVDRDARGLGRRELPRDDHRPAPGPVS
jgi:hypothetical protein